MIRKNETVLPAVAVAVAEQRFQIKQMQKVLRKNAAQLCIQNSIGLFPPPSVTF